MRGKRAKMLRWIARIEVGQSERRLKSGEYLSSPAKALYRRMKREMHR